MGEEKVEEEEEEGSEQRRGWWRRKDDRRKKMNKGDMGEREVMERRRKRGGRGKEGCE